MIMVSNHASLLILVLWSSVKVSGILKPVHDNEIYFEVIEPAEISYTFRGRLAGNFGSDFDRFLKNVYLIPSQPLKGCSQLHNHRQVKGNIVMIERGECSFISKVLSAEQVGALGVIIVDNNQLVNDQYVDMIDDLTQRTVKIPAVFITYRDGHMILNAIEKHHLAGALINIPLNLTYDDIFKRPPPPGSQWF